jgi:IMP dehydrogenase
MSIITSLSYDDVLLVPQYSDIRSRKEVSLASDLDPSKRLEIPIISSPMDTITEATMANAIQSMGGLGVIHRYNTIEQQVDLVRRICSGRQRHRAAAIGVSGDFLERASELVAVGANILCLDVAHGHHVLMKEAIKKIKILHGDSVHIMAGNVATRKGFEDLAHWGADSIRCNIGGGSICSTRIQTGHGVPGLHTILDCIQADIRRDVKIIADGGIRNSGDIVKALAAGADFVMIGSLLSGTKETPGDIIYHGPHNRDRRKVYRGMASKEAQFDWRGRHSSNEGVTTHVPYKGDVGNIITELVNGIRSGLSYSGARNITEFQIKSEFIVQTPSGQAESGTHILSSQ